MPPALAVNDLRKAYGRTEALRGVGLEVDAAERVDGAVGLAQAGDR